MRLPAAARDERDCARDLTPVDVRLHHMLEAGQAVA